MNTSADEFPAAPLVADPPKAPDDAQFDAAPPATHHAAAPVQAQCANCGITLLGPHCYACGQPVKGMVRHLSSILSDAADTILNIDSRIFRTLWPLYVRPGFLTTEYFAGRRVRYVTPFRLYFFLSIAAFFLIQFSIDDMSSTSLQVHEDNKELIAKALTGAEVIQQRDAAIAEAKAEANNNADSSSSLSAAQSKRLDKAIESVNRVADKRLDYLKRVEEAKARGETPPPDKSDNNVHLMFDNKMWDPKADPVHVSWLPHFVNEKLTQLGERAQDNVAKFEKNRDFKPFFVGTVSVLPQVLFVLMPLFAFVLKIFYIFKRRLYMEHLIVALHSHAFIFLSLIGLTLAYMIKGWAADSAPWLEMPLRWIIFAMGWWLPIYLFMMQKKVYKQGWILTTLKYSTIGIGYTIMVAIGVSIAFLVSLATV
jgi:Protein of unknown function (DUF3667)